MSIPFPTRRATFKEIKRVHEVLMTIDLHSETLEQLRSNLVDDRPSRNSTNKLSSAKKSQIRRSKSRETPNRELPDFVQSLADEANSESEEETGFLKADLQEFECTKKPKKKVTDHKVELQNSLVTSAKSGDLKLFNLLMQNNESKVKALLNEPLGDAKVTFLHLASKEGHSKIIQSLLEYGADPTLKDKAKKTPYSYCPDKNVRLVFRRFQVIQFYSVRLD